MTETIEITAEIELDDIHAQMLEQLREKFGSEAVDADLETAAINESALQQSIYQSYMQIQQEQQMDAVMTGDE